MKIKDKKVRQKAEDFIGWKSEDGLLEVVDLLEKSKRPKFKVICKICSPDIELYPLGYFICSKDFLKNGGKPCGCSNKPERDAEQYLIIAKRVAEGRFIVHGFAEEFHGQTTKLDCECLVHSHKWTPAIASVMAGQGCILCGYENRASKRRLTETDAFDKCNIICKEMNYKSLGFPEGYKNCYSLFEYECPKHGKKKVSYNALVSKGSRCRDCWKERQIEILRDTGNGNGYYLERAEEQDYLYILNFNNKFIKVGRSFDVDERMKNLRTKSKVSIRKIYKLRIFTATHKEIYDYEQELMNKLREKGFQYSVSWSNECFENESLYTLNKLLNDSKLKELVVNNKGKICYENFK